MQNWIALPSIIVAAFSLAACGYTPEQRAVNGAAIGAGTGALLGAATGGSAGAALAGGALGAATGAIIGANTRPAPPPPPPVYAPPPPPPACARWGYYPNGQPYCAAFYGY